MKSMRFDVSCVKDCLKNNGKVFTVRSWNDYDVESLVDVKDIGVCKKIKIAKMNSIDDIKRYVKLSGFNSVEDWYNKIKMFKAEKGYIYLVSKI